SRTTTGLCGSQRPRLKTEGAAVSRSGVRGAGGPAMDRSLVGWVLLFCGWAGYAVALVCPAIDYTFWGLDSSVSGTKTGACCFCDSFNAKDWLFAPLLMFYAGANVLMAFSLVAVAFRALRRTTSVLLLWSSLLTLTAPVCSEAVRGVLIGCYLWILS